MVDVPNTEYITVNANGVFVGGKPATHYRGVKIYGINYVNDALAWIQEQNPNITELHVLSSETSGRYGTVGNPSPEHGRYAWCRVKYKDGQFGGWVFVRARASAPLCALSCAYDCASNVRVSAAFQRAVLGTAFDNGQNRKNAQDDLGCIDWSQKLGVHNVGPYRIIVEKAGPNTK